MARLVARKGRRVMRHMRVRRKIRGTPDRPRLAVFRSLKQVYAQLIDDTQGITLAAATSLDSEIRNQTDNKIKRSELVGGLIAERAKTKGITTAVFDRGGYKYHGRVKKLAEAARAAGLVI